MTPWEIEGRELINCNCSYGCPCQFNALPTKGFCEAMGAIAVDKGRYGEVRLDGLKLGVVFQWPGPIHEGKGKCQPIVDAKASAQQREALLKIMSGQDTEPFATMFAVFASTVDKVFDPIFTGIDFDVDIEARRGKVRVEGVFEVNAEPIRNPVTGKEHFAQIRLPNGFEFREAEMASGRFNSEGPELGMSHQNCYGFLSYVAYGPRGVIA